MEKDNIPKTAKEPEITPEMIEAGASILYGMSLDVAREEFWAEEVYRAMASVSPDVRARVAAGSKIGPANRVRA